MPVCSNEWHLTHGCFTACVIRSLNATLWFPNFTVGGESGKVKRLRNNPNVTLQKCDVRGRVVAGTPVVVATARVVTGPDCEPINVAMRNKYKIQFRMLEWSSAITSKIKRQSVADAAVIVTFN